MGRSSALVFRHVGHGRSNRQSKCFLAKPRSHHSSVRLSCKSPPVGRLRSLSASMKPILIAAAFVACVAVATTQATEGSRHDVKIIASEIARGLIGGIILGVNVGPYLSGLIPAHIESRVTASGYAPAPPLDAYSVADE